MADRRMRLDLGAEAVFGVSATFVKDGLRGVVADPFGSSLCLIIAGFFFAKKLYKLNILTLGDYFRMRYNRTVEVVEKFENGRGKGKNLSTSSCPCRYVEAMNLS